MLNPRPRDIPYVHVSYLCKLLTGEAQCEWAAWFKSQFLYDKQPGANAYHNSDHHIKHTKLLQKQRDELKEEGYAVSVEDQNSFTWRGQSAKLAGTPDLIGILSDECLIVDVKSGAPLASHEVQILLYMWAVPKELKRYAGLKTRGLLVYENEHKFINAERLTASFINDAAQLIRKLADAKTPAHKVPSARECKFCAINNKDCPERYVETAVDETEKIENEFF